jgi:hypothetical protein
MFAARRLNKFAIHDWLWFLKHTNQVLKDWQSSDVVNHVYANGNVARGRPCIDNAARADLRVQFRRGFVLWPLADHHTAKMTAVSLGNASVVESALRNLNYVVVWLVDPAGDQVKSQSAMRSVVQENIFAELGYVDGGIWRLRCVLC